MTVEKNDASIGSICVFCGSSSVVDEHYFELARATGRAIAASGQRLVYGGGGVGLMGATAKAAFNAGGDVLGIMPEFLQVHEGIYRDVPHKIVPDMHTRKAMMYEQSDAFIVLPGGIGTLEEAVEIISWLRMRLHNKPVVFVDTDDYWTPIIELITHTIEAKFTPDWMSGFLFRDSDPVAALKTIETAKRQAKTLAKTMDVKL